MARYPKLTGGVCLLHGNTQPHAEEKNDKVVKAMWLGKPWPPSYSPGDFQPSFVLKKEFLDSKQMATEEEVKETVTDSLYGPVGNFYDERIVKFVQHSDKCLNCNRDDVEKQTNVIPNIDMWINSFICLPEWFLH
jgi:hypothetical protein